MSVLSVKAPAKVNLVLEVLGKRSDTYHEVSTILQEVPDLFDTIEMKRSSNITIKCDNKEVPTDENNTIFRTLNILQDALKVRAKYSISLEKKIPCRAGLGGSCSDAAAVLKAVNKDLGLELTKGQMLEILKQIGSDAAFFLEGGIQLGTQRGDKLSSLPNLPPCKIKVIDTGIKINTTEAYETLELPFPREAMQTYKVIEGIRELDIDKVAENLHNDFQAQAIQKYPKIKQAMDNLIEKGAISALMTGSGGAVFGIF